MIANLKFYPAMKNSGVPWLGELTQDAVVKNFFTTAADGKNYSAIFYGLDAIISVGYRVKSRVATQFRIWPARNVERRYCRTGATP